MDKLEPIIKHRFWILLGLCLPMAMFGFFRGQSQINAETAAREDVLKTKLNSVSSGKEPNDFHKQGLKNVTDVYSSSINDETRKLIEEQRVRMWWPRLVAQRSDFPKKYYGSFSPEARGFYQKAYPDVIEKLWQKAEPVAGKNDKPTWENQKVYFDRHQLPQQVIDRYTSSRRIWYAQEDVWFCELLFEAIRGINRNSDSPLNSIVRKINRIELRGGSGADSGGEESADEFGAGGDYAADYATGMSNMGGMMGMSEMMNPSGARGGGMRTGGGTFSAPVEINANEEFGSNAGDPGDGDDEEGESESAETDIGTSDDPSAAYNASMSGMSGLTGMSAMYSGGGAGGAGLRWIAEDASETFRERGFYLSVIMHQQHIPDFMIELTNCAWPLQIVRFHMGPNPYYSEASQPPGGGYPGGGGLSGGYPGVSGGYPGMTGGYPGAASSGGGSSSSMASAGALLGGAARGAGRSGPGDGSTGGMAEMMMRAGGGSRGMSMGMMGGAGIGGAGARSPSVFGSANDPFPFALNNPDLVQVDVIGIITFYSLPEEEATADEAADENLPTRPEGADAVPADASSDPAAAEGESPAADGDAANVEGDSSAEAPAVDEAVSDPAEAEEFPADRPAEGEAVDPSALEGPAGAGEIPEEAPLAPESIEGDVPPVGDEPSAEEPPAAEGDVSSEPVGDEAFEAPPPAAGPGAPPPADTP